MDQLAECLLATLQPWVQPSGVQGKASQFHRMPCPGHAGLTAKLGLMHQLLDSVLARVFIAVFANLTQTMESSGYREPQWKKMPPLDWPVGYFLDW